MRNTLKNKHHRVLAYVEVDGRGVHTISDHHHRVLGHYDPRTNRTTDRHHRLVGHGYLLPKLVPGGLAEDEAGVVKPRPPLTPEGSRREADRRAALQKRIRDAQASCAAKVRDLQADLARKP